MWPKLIDLSLCILWAGFVVTFYVIPKGKTGFFRLCTFLRFSPLHFATATLRILSHSRIRFSRRDFAPFIDSGVIVNGLLCALSILSVVIGYPWVLQHAVDTPKGKTYVALSASASVLSERDRREKRGFWIVSAALTMYWALLFASLSTIVAINATFNTVLHRKDMSLTHRNRMVFLVLGIGVPFGIVFFGIWSTPKFGDVITNMLRRRATQAMAAPVVRDDDSADQASTNGKSLREADETTGVEKSKGTSNATAVPPVAEARTTDPDAAVSFA